MSGLIRCENIEAVGVDNVVPHPAARRRRPRVAEFRFRYGNWVRLVCSRNDNNENYAIN